MGGRERSCRRGVLYVWQGKRLRARFCYVWQGKELRGNRRTEEGLSGRVPPHPGGNSDYHQSKGVAGKAIRKTMKTKGRQTVNADWGAIRRGEAKRSAGGGAGRGTGTRFGSGLVAS